MKGAKLEKKSKTKHKGKRKTAENSNFAKLD
jgi:hypothetical protein